MWEKHLTRHQREQIKVEETSQKVNLSLEQMNSAYRQVSSPLQMLKVTAELDLEAGGPDTIFPLQVEKPPKKFFRSSKEKKEEKLLAQREKEHQEEQRESKAQLMTQREFVEQMIPVVSSEDSSDEAMAAMLKVGAKRLMERPEIQKAYTPQ